MSFHHEKLILEWMNLNFSFFHLFINVGHLYVHECDLFCVSYLYFTSVLFRERGLHISEITCLNKGYWEIMDKHSLLKG